MPSEKQVQEFVHRLEEGRWVKWVQLTALITVCALGFTVFIFDPLYWGVFKGLSHSKGMEQAQIAREIARGHGFATQVIRPLAVAQFKKNTGSFPLEVIPDTYHAPLWPATLAPFLLVIKEQWPMTEKDYIYVADRMVAGVGILFFFLAVLVNYFTIRRLFDHQLAILAVGLVLVGDVFWKYSQSGLPQMQMLFLLSGAAYLMLRAVENQIDGRPVLNWLLGASAVFGLLALAHGITIWIFAGALFFCGVYFKPRLQTVLLMLGVFLVVYSPWLVRNYNVCGSPFGTALYSGLYQVRGTESMIMRGQELNFAGVSPTVFRNKIQGALSVQLGSLFDLLGRSLLAPVFFVALMHLFKNRKTSVFRWLLLSMWVFAAFGMAVVGSDDGFNPLMVNNIYLLFIPLFVAYGLAFILVLWTRLEINVVLVRRAFITLLFAITGLPLLNTLISGNKSPFQWPPYVPPYIAILNKWTTEQEIVSSDMPWGVAWYADRKSLWLPATVQEFIQFYDTEFTVPGESSGRIAGLYLTPVSGNVGLLSDIVKGDYKEWAPFILRAVNSKDFPLRTLTALPIDNQCIFYADHDRWTNRMD